MSRANEDAWAQIVQVFGMRSQIQRKNRTHTPATSSIKIYVQLHRWHRVSKHYPASQYCLTKQKFHFLKFISSSLYYNKYNGFAIYTMLCPWLYSSSCKHSHHWKYVCKSQNPHQPHAETDSFMKNGGLIGSLLGSSLSLLYADHHQCLYACRGQNERGGWWELRNWDFFIEK